LFSSDTKIVSVSNRTESALTAFHRAVSGAPIFIVSEALRGCCGSDRCRSRRRKLHPPLDASRDKDHRP
jgi:hypothetical protein